MGVDVNEYMGRRLYCRRRALGLTQQQVADAIGVRFQQIQKYECGGNKMSAARVWALAQALGVPASYFYEGLSAEMAPAPNMLERRSA
jgi:transcriptional regulator with XRE-family HTH domain